MTSNRAAIACGLVLTLSAARVTALETAAPTPDGTWTWDALVILMVRTKTAKDMQRIYEEFKPDLLEWHHGIYCNRGDFFTRRGVRVSGGAWEREYQEYVTWYDRDWQRRMEQFDANGVAWRRGAKRVWDGRKRYCASMCHNAPKWHIWHNQGLLRPVPFADTISQDNVNVVGFAFGRGAFCPWCLAGLRDYLRGRFDEARLRQMGVRDPETFDFLEYANEKSLPFSNDILTDAVAREYVKYQYTSQLDKWQEAVRQVKDEARRLGRPLPPIYGNQYAVARRAYGMIQCGSVDVVWTEDGTHLPFPGNGRAAHNTFRYKAGFAAGDYARPVWGCLYPKNNAQWRTAWAEAQANGGTICFSPPNEAYRKYAAFLHANRHLFRDRTSLANVALVYPLVTTMWTEFPGLGLRDPVPASQVNACSRALEESHIPYDVVCLFHPQLRDDSVGRERLKRYGVLILAGARCLSDVHLDALCGAARAGAKIIVCDEVGSHTEDHVRRELTALAPKLVAADVTSQIESILAASNWEEPARAQAVNAFAAAVRKQLDVRFLETDAPPSVWTNLWQHGRQRLAVHLVNYDLDGSEIVPAKDIKCRVGLPEALKPTELWFHSPDAQPTRGAFRLDGRRAEFTVPEVESYVIASLTTPGEMPAAGSLAKAAKALDRLAVAGDRRDDLGAGLAAAMALYREGEFPPARERAARIAASAVERLAQSIARQEKADAAGRDRTIAMAENAVLALDLGSTEVAPGFERLAADLEYESQRGYGWLETDAIEEVVSEGPDPLHRDFLRCEFVRTLRVNLPAGDYAVTMVTGEANMSYHWDALVDVRCNGQLVCLGVLRRGGFYRRNTFCVKSNGTPLDITFSARAAWESATHAHDWSVDGLIIAVASRAQQAVAFLRDWIVSGPQDGSDWLGLDRKYPQESSIEKAGPWVRYESAAQIPDLDAPALLGGDDESVYVVATEVVSPVGQKARLRVGIQARGKVWLNGQMILRDVRAAGLCSDEYEIPVALNRGPNLLLVKMTTDWIGAAWCVSVYPEKQSVTSSAARLATAVNAAPALRLDCPSIIAERNRLCLGRPVQMKLIARNASATQSVSGALSLALTGAQDDAVRIEPAAVSFKDVPPNQFAQGLFEVTLMRPIDVVWSLPKWRMDVPDRIKLVARVSVGKRGAESARWLDTFAPRLEVRRVGGEAEKAVGVFEASISNPTDDPVQCRISCRAPVGWQIAISTPELAVAQGATTATRVTASGPAGLAPGEYPMQIAAIYVAPDGQEQELTAEATVVRGGLAGHWSFDEGQGTVANDDSGQRNHAGFVGAPEWANGRRGKALRFDGGASYLAAPHSDTLNITQSVSVACWVCADKFVGNDIILTKTDLYNEYLLYCDGRGILHGRIRYRGASARDQNVLTAPKPLLPGRWYHLCFTWDRRGTALYIDGKVVASGKSTLKAIGDTRETFRIGGGEYAGGFAGIIDEVCVYNYALTNEDIRKLMLSAKK